ncbi:AAA domain-containing protein [Carboxydocella sp. ULO1]|uniref:AAA domain-containing protein n=1 Tax=Carboxydocella sp. ULO1 TaxID=1926599 RepID=UPI0009AD99E7|nr:AAA domain-containing protein [Carboxydocella sp. ULO1]GAW27522.1 hypothetical protein ULO1_00920 [Carboxydocella sp. ULO1]
MVVYINDGQLLNESNQNYTYLFLLADEISLPDGNPVRIIYKNKTVYGEVVALEGFDIIIEVSDYIGNIVEEAELYSEPWNILEELKKRLKEVIDSKNYTFSKTVLYGGGRNELINHKFKNKVTELVARAYRNNTTYIWGPPGTGKTHNLAKITDYFMLKNRTVLLLSHSNAAVDGLVHKIYELRKEDNMWIPGEVVRFGAAKLPEVLEHETILASRLVEYKYPELKGKKQNLVNEQQYLRKKVKSGNATRNEKERLAYIEEELKELRKKIRLIEDEYVTKAQVLGVTLSKAALNSLIYNKKYDLVIVDEASMAYIPHVVFAASLAKKSVVICGDFMQLPPIAIGQHELIERWVKAKQAIADLEPFPGKALALIDLNNLGAYALKEWDRLSRFNIFSAILSVYLIIMATKNQTSSIGYISPFNAQARLVSAFLLDLLPNTQEDKEKRIIAATVHKFQGSERDIVIYDVVENFPQKKASILLTGQETDRLVNVAVTRARGKLIKLADTNFLREQLNQNNPTMKLILYMMKNGTIVNWLNIKEILKNEKINGLEWYIDIEEKNWINEINKAKEELIISLPYINKAHEGILAILRNVSKTANIYFLTNEPEKINGIKSIIIQRDYVASFLIVDRKIIIYGAPQLLPSKLVVKIKAPRAAKLLVNFLGLNDNFVVNQEVAVTREIALKPPTYSLRDYVETWVRCYLCGSSVNSQIRNNGIVLVCSFCGKENKISTPLLKKYIAYVNLKCRKCSSYFEARKGKFGPYLECHGCGERIGINRLWSC